MGAVSQHQQQAAVKTMNNIKALLFLVTITHKATSGENCFDPPGVTGPCRASFPRWTYRRGVGCSPFKYGGCRGNGNNFNTAAQCQATCQGTSVGGGGGGVGGGGLRTVQSVCDLQPFLFGSCRFSLQRWSYVWQTNSCQPFTYSGCDSGAPVNR